MAVEKKSPAKAVAKKGAAKKSSAPKKKTVAKKKIAAKVVAKTAPKAASKAKKKVATKTATKTKVATKAKAVAGTKNSNVDESAVVTKIDLGFIGSKDEVAESRNVASRARVRSSLEGDIEQFLQKGGKIENVAPNVMADPPRKPESNYGSRPI